MTKYSRSFRVLIYMVALTAACTGWWYQSRKAARLEGRLMQAEHSLSQMDLRITSLALAVLSSYDDEDPGRLSRHVVHK